MTSVVNDYATAMRELPQRIIAAWADNDGDAFAAAFAEDATVILPNDVYLSGREQIAKYMNAAYAGPYKGTKVTGMPIAVRPIADGVALVITRGGVIDPGETELTAENAIRASWLLARQGDEWLIAAYQNTPIGTSAAA